MLEEQDAAAPTKKSSWSEQFAGRPAVPTSGLPSSCANLEADRLLVFSFLRRADHRGTDLRMDTGCAFRPQAVQRAAIPSHYWVWEAVSSYPWRTPDQHINALELTAYLNHLKDRSADTSTHSTRFLALLDSQAPSRCLAC